MDAKRSSVCRQTKREDGENVVAVSPLKDLVREIRLVSTTRREEKRVFIVKQNETREKLR